jgi:hypothetical protein
MHGLIAKTQETQTAQMKCYAGTAGGVIYDEGTVSSCENLSPIGNLRDFDWDFQKLWLSPAMKERRKKAASVASVPTNQTVTTHHFHSIRDT